jgi:hypothetical protein
MTEAEIIALINLHIVANGNNEITANILRPILQAMLLQTNDKIGELTDLGTTDKTSIVNALNEVLLSSLPSGSVILAETFTYTSPNNVFVTTNNILSLIDVQIGNGCNFDEYATVDNGNEVTIDNSIIFGGEKIKIIYTK